MLDDLRECYRILDVEPSASLDEVKRSYRELVKVWHPDRFTNDPSLQAKAQEKLKQINLAYERISKGETAESNGRTASVATPSAGSEPRRGPSSSQESQRQSPGNPPPPKPEPSQAEASRNRPVPQSGTKAQWRHAVIGFGFLALSLWLASILSDDFAKYEAGEVIRTTRKMFLLYQLLGKQGVVVLFLLFGCFMGYFGLCHARALMSGQVCIRSGLKKGHLIASAVILGFFVFTGDRPGRRNAQSHPVYTQAASTYPVQPPSVVQPTPGTQFSPRQATALPDTPVVENRNVVLAPTPGRMWDFATLRDPVAEESKPAAAFPASSALENRRTDPIAAPSQKPDFVTPRDTIAEESELVQFARANQLRKASEQGNAEAQFELGKAYSEGLGVKKDVIEATKWFRNAAEQDHTEALLKLGVAYELGQGVPKDDAEAVRWFRKAAEKGEARAQFNLGTMYAGGGGVPKDDAEAVKWFRKAAEQGNNDAQYNLGFAYDNGQGVPKDEIEAYKWFLLAGNEGQLARLNLSRLEQEISASQREEGQRRAREFKVVK